MSQHHSARGNTSTLDIRQRYVRFEKRRHDGFVEFEFAIGDPSLSVSLIMKETDYQKFCCRNAVIFIR